ncbi:MAG TPA: helix-turn-helix domain-containing protein [Roseiflexaceae bacterium]|nr:helix-turn-helix domain-containing protein [Roseiflexaceae bacterium]
MGQTIDGVEYLDVAEATALLGVKKATLYAYVSRGVLSSYRMGVGRGRLYRRAEVEALRAVRPSAAPRETPPADDVFRDVHLPNVADWAPDH